MIDFIKLTINLVASNTTIDLIGGSNDILVTKAEQKKDLMGEDTLSISYESPTIVAHTIGDNLSLFGERYTLNLLPTINKGANGNYRHDLVFESRLYELIKILFLDIDKSGNNWIGRTADFPLTGTMDRFLTVITDNITRVHGADLNWKQLTISYNINDLPTTVKTISFNSSNCLQALQQICKEFDVQYHVEVGANDAVTIFINKKTDVSVFPDTLQYGYNGGLFEINREIVSTKGIVTRLYAYGGTRNIPYNYRNGTPRLKLPVATNIDSFVDNSVAIAKLGVIEMIKNFDDIYPTYKFVASSADGYLTFGGCPFDLNAVDGEGQTIYIVAGNKPKVHFNSGELAGYEFEVDKFDSATLKITLSPFTDSTGAVYPFDKSVTPSGVYCIENGDEFILLDIKPDSSKITEAESLLLVEANKYLTTNLNPEVTYSLQLDEWYFMNKYASELVNGYISNPFVVGQYLKITDVEMGINNLQLRISSLTRDVLNPYRYTLEISDTYNITYLERLVVDNKATKEIIIRNKLQDPIRAKRNWQSTSELSNMLTTLSAELLLIGDKAGSYYTDLVVTTNYNNNENGFNVSTGVVQHQAYTNSVNDTWNISSEFNASFLTDTALYIYIRCSKTTQVGEIVADTTKRGVDMVDWYYFPFGILSSVFGGQRIFNSTRGYTAITGSNIKTGVIQDPDEKLIIDLENATIIARNGATIEGTIKFTPNGGTVQDLSDWSATRESEIEATQIVANNAIDAAGDALLAANTANALLADIASDSKLTPDEKPDIRREWDIIASEKTANDAQADVFAISKIAYGTAFENLGIYLNAGAAWVSPAIPSWIADANLSVTTAIVGATFRSTFKAYYDARTALLNAIVEKSKTLADAAQVVADSKSKKFTGTSNPTTPYVAGRDIWTNGTDLYECIVSRASGAYVANDFVKATGYDNTQTVIDGGIVTGGTVQVVQGGTVAAGMTGNTLGDTAVRFWAGATMGNRATAPFRVLQDGSVTMTKATVQGNITADSGKIGNWEIAGGGIFNDEDSSYIIARLNGISGTCEARIGSNVVAASAGISVPAFFMNEIENWWNDNTALIVSAKHGVHNKAIQALGSIVMVCGDAISSQLNYMNLYAGSTNVISILDGLKISAQNYTGSPQALYLPSLSSIRSDLGIGSRSVLSAAAVSSLTTKTYYVVKGNGLFVYDSIKYGTSGYTTITEINRYSSSVYDIITVEKTLGVSVANGESFTTIHELSVEILIVNCYGSASSITVFPNGANWANNTGTPLNSVVLPICGVMKVGISTRENAMFYQLIHYKTA